MDHEACLHSSKVMQGTRLNSAEHKLLPADSDAKHSTETGVCTASYRHWWYVWRHFHWWVLHLPHTALSNLLSDCRANKEEAQTKTSFEAAGLRWLPRVSTKVTIRTGKTCKRSPSSVILQSLFLNFTSKVTNIITLIFQVLLLRHRPLSWQQSN